MEKLRMIIVAFFMMQFNALFSQNWVGEFSLEGKINDIGTGRIVLSYNQIIDGKLCSYSDATDIVDGKFCFRGTINEPSFAFLSINDSKVCIMLDAAPMKITFSSCDIDNYHLIGSLTNDENRMIKCEFSRLGDSLSVLNKKIEELKGHLSPKELDRIERQKDSIWLQRQRVSLDIVKINPHSFMALKYLSSFSPNWLSLDEAQKIYDNFTADQKCVPTARLAAFLMENKRISMVGKRASDFQFVDDKGLKHFLSDFQQKNYVLLDFGSSGCGACIENIPYIKECYSRYRDKGLIIIGISSESSERAWKKHIQKYKMQDYFNTWEDYRNNTNLYMKTIMRSYDVSALPRYVLIDRGGIIIGRWGSLTAENKKEFEASLEKNIK